MHAESASPGFARIRFAEPADMARVTEIYGYYVLNSVATFEFDPPGVQEMAARSAAIIRHDAPFLVAERGSRILGYAYAGPYRTRPAYKHTVENSIYLDPDAVGKGLGAQLLSALVVECSRRGFRQMIAIIGGGAENAASARLHARCGFRHVGMLTAVGKKFGRWVDTLLMQKELGET